MVAEFVSDYFRVASHKLVKFHHMDFIHKFEEKSGDNTTASCGGVSSCRPTAILQFPTAGIPSVRIFWLPGYPVYDFTGCHDIIVYGFTGSYHYTQCTVFQVTIAVAIMPGIVHHFKVKDDALHHPHLVNVFKHCMHTFNKKQEG